MSEANWPIRVGGEYRSSRYPESQYARVTAIDGQIIYLERLRKDGAQHTFPADDMVAGAFRRCYRPGDQSPLPEMYEAHKALNRAFRLNQEQAEKEAAASQKSPEMQPTSTHREGDNVCR